MSSLLIVEDDVTIREMLFDLLSEEHSCFQTNTAEEALKILESEDINVVLTDISMPGMSGLELLGHVLQRFPDTPVIMISGISDQEHARGLIKLGAFDFLLKPFSLEAVEKSVRRAVEYRKHLLQNSTGEQRAADVSEEDTEANDWKIMKQDPQ